MDTFGNKHFDFLKKHPPFNILSQSQLEAVSHGVKIIHSNENDYLFEVSTPVNKAFYIVKNGGIGLFTNENVLVDKCDEGDIFGLRALIYQGKYMLSAKVLEKSIIYSISFELYETHIARNLEAKNFVISSFVSNTKNQSYNWSYNNAQTANFSEELLANYSKTPVHCSPETSIKSAATIMTQNRVGSVIITKNLKPIGILTDKDLRSKIATGIVPITEPVSKIMSSPVICFPEKTTITEAQIAMLEHQITHLCITKDGTGKTELIGVLSEHDIVIAFENTASAQIKAIKQATSVITLKSIRQRTKGLLDNYLKQQISISYIAKIISTINNNITCKIIDLALQAMPSAPPIAFAWLAIGSQGREEQLLLTDQDNALVFDHVSSEEDYVSIQEYFLLLASKITEGLNEVGFEYCPADMMGSNPKWCMSVSQWENQFQKWIVSPHEDNLMLCTIFFDFKLIYGVKTLVDNISQGILQSINSYDIFLNFLARNALKNPPPLSFFRQFLVEQDGKHKDQFDIKARAIMPLVDAARVLTLSKNNKESNNTIGRFAIMERLEPENQDVYRACIESFKTLLNFRTLQGLLHDDSGRFINLQSLSKFDRLELKRCFKAVKEVQELIKTRFNLSQFM